MGTNSWSRRVGALIAAAVIVASCSSDDDASPTSDPPPTDAPATTDPSTTEAGGLTGEGLELGLLAPAPGLLSTLFLGQDRGAAFAVADVDDGGGVVEGPLTAPSYPAAPGSEPGDNVDDAIAGGAAVLLGPPGSDGAEAVRDAVAAADSITCSASATLPRITQDQDPLTLFRTALPDDVTTTYLATAIAERRDEVAPSAAWKVAIVARADEYGLSVGNGLAATLQAAGMVPAVINYNPRRVLFTETSQQVVAAQPDLTILVTYAEGANLLASLVADGLDPSTMIGLDGFFAPRIASRATPGGDAASVDGFTMLGSMGTNAFLQRLYDDDPNGEVANAPQAYDCAVLLALATEAVADGSSESMAQAVVDVSGGGTTCTTYADCLDKLLAGEDIDYDGVSGQINLDESGDPTFARFTTATLLGGSITDISSTDVDITVIRRQQEAYAAAAQITKIQQALRFLGFYSGPINGLDTEEFRAALAAFQTSVGLPATGVYDEATDAALRAALGPYAELLTATTADIQRLLTDLGFYSGPIDGVWTEELSEAIRALQRELGVPETGVLDAATVRAIYVRGADSATTTTAPPETTSPPTTAPSTTAPATTAPPTTTPPATTAPPTTAPPVDPPQPDLPSLFEVLQEDPDNFSMFVELLLAAGFDADFAVIGPFTVFAPTNAALETLSDDEFDGLLADPERLNELLGYHVVEGRLLADSITADLVTINGAILPVAGSGAEVTVGGSPISVADVLASNGVVQGIGSLLTVPAS